MKKTYIFLLVSFLINVNILQLSAQGVVSRPAKQVSTKKTAKTTSHIKQRSTSQTTKKSNVALESHEWVDLGLPSGIKWATCNLGAYSPEQYGYYYAWGENVKTQSESTRYSTYGKNGEELFSNGIIDTNGSLKSSHDMVHNILSGSWRLPTKKEFQELIDNCIWTYTILNGVDCFKVMGPNRQSIYLPAAGYYEKNTVCEIGKSGGYWSSSTNGNSFSASALQFDKDSYEIIHGIRYYRYSVRPVKE